MKKFRFFLALSLLLSSLAIMAQKYNPEIYDERGQYLKETPPPVYQENRFEFGLYSMGPKVYPSGTVEAFASYRSGFGTWGFLQYSQAVISKEWVDKGYTLSQKRFNLGMNIALSYDFYGPRNSQIKVFGGLGYRFGQSFFGPLAGGHLTVNRWHIRAFGLYATSSAYKSSYSDISEESYALYGHLGDPIIIDGFDPNSWWRITCGYKLSDRFNLGFISERFYATGLFGEYELRFPSMEIKKMYLKFISGRNFMFKENSFFMGTVLYL